MVKWKGLALGYILDIIIIVYNFIINLLDIVYPVERVQKSIISLLIDRLLGKY